jgi:hypothetical protein
MRSLFSDASDIMLKGVIGVSDSLSLASSTGWCLCLLSSCLADAFAECISLALCLDRMLAVFKAGICLAELLLTSLAFASFLSVLDDLTALTISCLLALTVLVLVLFFLCSFDLEKAWGAFKLKNITMPDEIR